MSHFWLDLQAYNKICLLLLLSIHGLDSVETSPALSFHILEVVSDFLKMTRLVIVVSNPTDINRNWAKTLYTGRSFRITRKVVEVAKDSEENIVIDSSAFSQSELSTVLKSMPNLGTMSPCLIALGSQQEVESSALPAFRVNQRVFFFALDEGTISERYTVGEVIVENTLATVDLSTGDLTENPDVNQNFMERRSDLHGAALNTFACSQNPYLDILPRPSGRERVVHKIKEGLEREVVYPEQLYGIFRDLQIVMQQEMNLTFNYYLCEGRNWGDQYENGTFYGMVDIIHRGDMDLLAGSLTLKPSRAAGVSYLHPIGIETYGLILPAVESEQLDWTVYVDPYHPTVWIVLGLNILVSSLVISTMHHFRTDDSVPIKVSNTMGTMWDVAKTYVGGTVAVGTSKKIPVQLSAFVVSLCGVVVWASYRASLTSELATRTTRMPLSNLYELLDSEYQMVMMGGGAAEYLFRKSPPGSLHDRIFKKMFDTQEKLEDNMIYDEKAAMNIFLAKALEGGGTKYTLWFVLETAYTHKELWCKFSVPWESHFPAFLSMATPQDSPYLPFMRNFVLKHIEQGSLDKMNSRWKEKAPSDCGGEGKGSALGGEKMISVFAIWAAGAGLALAVAAGESVRGVVRHAGSCGREKTTPYHYDGKRKSVFYKREEDMAATAAAVARYLDGNFRKEGGGGGGAPSEEERWKVRRLIGELEEIIRELKDGGGSLQRQ